jgi:hypothetical protein
VSAVGGSGVDEAEADEEQVQVPRMTREQEEAQRRAFPDLFRFFDDLQTASPAAPVSREREQMVMQREEMTKQSRLTQTRLADYEEDEEDEERWDESVRFDAPLVAETPSPEQRALPRQTHSMQRGRVLMSDV